jgi:hypothetical protein
MTQTLYAHMNKIKIKNKNKAPAFKNTWKEEDALCVLPHTWSIMVDCNFFHNF